MTQSHQVEYLRFLGTTWVISPEIKGKSAWYFEEEDLVFSSTQKPIHDIITQDEPLKILKYFHRLEPS